MEQTIDLNKVDFTPDPDLVGQPIRVMDAHRKYGVPQNTISQWAYSGLVRIIERAPKLLLLDEATVAKAAAIFKYARELTSPRKAAWILKKALATD